MKPLIYPVLYTVNGWGQSLGTCIARARREFIIGEWISRFFGSFLKSTDIWKTMRSGTLFYEMIADMRGSKRVVDGYPHYGPPTFCEASGVANRPAPFLHARMCAHNSFEPSRGKLPAIPHKPVLPSFRKNMSGLICLHSVSWCLV